MSDITLDGLTAKRDGLIQQRTQLHDNLCAVEGAILICNELIKEATPPSDPPPVPPTESPSGNNP